VHSYLVDMMFLPLVRSCKTPPLYGFVS